MRRILPVSLLTLVVFAMVAAGTVWHLLHDEAFLKSRLNELAFRYTGRPLVIDGALQVELGTRTRLEARGIRYPDAEWAPPGDMVRIGHLQVVIDLRSLFFDTPVISSLLLEDCAVELRENETRDTNWRVSPEGSAAPHPGAPQRSLPFLLLEARARNCTLRHHGPNREQPLVVQIGDYSSRLLDDGRWESSGSGSIDREPLAFSGHLAPAGALLVGQPLQYEVEIRAGPNTLRSSGSIQDPHSGAGANLTARFDGPEIGRVLDYLALAPVSSGAFDFRLDLDTRAAMTRVAVDGDLGSLGVSAEGELDRLAQPTRGTLALDLQGPDLEAAGDALGLVGLVRESFRLQAEAEFGPGSIQLGSFALETDHDRLTAEGVIGTGKGAAASDLRIGLRSDDFGRWATAVGAPSRPLGSLTLDGHVTIDANGVAALKASLAHLGNALVVDGKLGRLGGPFHPRLHVDFSSDDVGPLVKLTTDYELSRAPATVLGQVAWSNREFTFDNLEIELDGHRARLDGVLATAPGLAGSRGSIRLDSPNLARLGRLFGRDGLPAAPLRLRGGLRRPDPKYLHLDQVHLDLGGHKLNLDGRLIPARRLAGSDLQARLDTPDLAALAALFGRAITVTRPVRLNARITPHGQGIDFELQDGTVGTGRVKGKGRIAELDRPLELDADFEVSLPSVAAFGDLAPGWQLPDLPASARGSLRRQSDGMRFENMQLALGPMTGTVSGQLLDDGHYDLAVEAAGPDATLLQPWTGWSFPAEAFSFAAGLSGDESALNLDDIKAEVGRSQGRGDLQIRFGARTHYSGSLNFPLLDVSRFPATPVAGAQADAERQSPFVFDDTPMLQLADWGVDVDLRVQIDELDLASLPLHDVDLGIHLDSTRMELNPITAHGEAEATLAGSFILSAARGKPHLRADLRGQSLQLGLLAGPNQDASTFPQTDLALQLDGIGSTRREMASGLNGKINLDIGAGQFGPPGATQRSDNLLTELLGILNPFSQKSAYATLECSVIAANIVDGQIHVFPVVYQTPELTSLSRGTIDLHSERIDLVLKSKPRRGLGISASALVNRFVMVGGTLARPVVQLDPSSAVINSGTAVATGGMSLVASSLADRFLASKDPCGDARKEIEKREQAGE